MKTFTKTLAIGLSSLMLFCTFSIAQSSGNSTNRAADRVANLSRSIEQGSLRGIDTRSAAKERFGIMRSLAETDPHTVLSNALSPDALSRMPETSRRYLETRESVMGELEVLAECEEHHGRIEYFVRQGDKRFPLYVAGELDSRFVSGKNVTVEAVKLDEMLVASADSVKSTETTSDDAATQSSALTGTTGEKRVLVILVNFQDKQTQPFTVEQARDVTFNTTSNYFREASYGQTSLAGDVVGWMTIPMSSTVCDKTGLSTHAKQAAQNAGVNLANYNHFVYGFPVNACTFGGSATVGGTNQVWINGVYDFATVGHELGHNLGLSHSRALDCGPDVIGDSCTTFEYGDNLDLMGLSPYAHFNLFQKERLGWVSSAGTARLQTISASGTYWIDAYVPVAGSIKGLKILKSTDPATGNKTWYYLERRTAAGFDSSFAGNANLLNGVVMHTGTDAAYQSYLLDMNPATNSWDDPALTAGQSFTDPAAGVTITTISADSSGALVQVTMAAQACTRANPSVTLTPGQTPWLSGGTAFAYTVTVANNNTGGCAADSFNVSANVPADWAVGYSSPVLNIAPGASLSTTLYVTSPAAVPNGVYTFGATAADASGYSGSSSATYTVVSNLGVSAVPGAAKYSRTQKASITATVTALGSGVAGASVVFTLTKPNGSTATKTVVADAGGRAVFVYAFDKRRDPLGTYVVTAAATGNGRTGSGSTSFLVNK